MQVARLAGGRQHDGEKKKAAEIEGKPKLAGLHRWAESVGLLGPQRCQGWISMLGPAKWDLEITKIGLNLGF